MITPTNTYPVEVVTPEEKHELENILASADFVELDFAREFEKIGGELTSRRYV